MRAREQTERMLNWWAKNGIERADLAVRRADGAMLWHAGLWRRRTADLAVSPPRSTHLLPPLGGGVWFMKCRHARLSSESERAARGHGAVGVW
jgi:hypothetical protein